MNNALPGSSAPPWPELPTAAWRETCATLHLWTQIVGKIRLARTPWLNHSWHVALYVTTSGLTTSPIPDGARTFQIDFDFINHDLRISTSNGATRHLLLAGHSVASFYTAVLTTLAELDVHVVRHQRQSGRDPFQDGHQRLEQEELDALRAHVPPALSAPPMP